MKLHLSKTVGLKKHSVYSYEMHYSLFNSGTFGRENGETEKFFIVNPCWISKRREGTPTECHNGLFECLYIFFLLAQR